MNSLAAIDLEVALLCVAQRKPMSIFPSWFFNCSLSDLFLFFSVSKSGLLLRTAAVIMRAYKKENKTLLWRQITLIETIFFTDDWQTEN